MTSVIYGLKRDSHSIVIAFMLNATLSKRIDVTPELVRFTIRPDLPFKPFLPGQYVALGLPGSAPRPESFPAEKELHAPDKLIKRAYSIGSAPEQTQELEFYIAIVPDGALTSRLALLREGDRIFIAPKITGTFTLHDVPADKNLVLVSTGTGLAPFISMLRSSSTWSEGRSIKVLHGVRYAQDLAYRDELEQMTSERRQLSYFPVVSRGEWSGKKGHVQRLFDDGTINLDAVSDHIFLCGNPAMIQELEVSLASKGFVEHTRKTPGNLHLEKYW